MSPWGCLLFTGWAVPAALLVDGRWLAGLALGEVAFGLVARPRALRLLRRPRFWAVILTAVALAPFLVGQPDVRIGPFPVSWEGLVAGLEMAGRAFTLALAVGLGVASLSLSDLVAVFDRLGLRGLGFATALAMNLLRTLHEMAAATLWTIWLRGGMRRPWTALRLFLVTSVANTLRYGDDVVNAASVRAFDPNAGAPATVALRRADLALLATLLACTVALLTARVH